MLEFSNLNYHEHGDLLNLSYYFSYYLSTTSLLPLYYLSTTSLLSLYYLSGRDVLEPGPHPSWNTRLSYDHIAAPKKWLSNLSVSQHLSVKYSKILA